MIEPRIEELIQLEIDGQNSPEESARLKAILESDGEARAHFEGLRSMTHDLARVGLVSAPQGLREEIERSLAQSQAETPVRPKRTARRVLSTREVFSFATGIAAGLALFAVINRDVLPQESLDPTTLSGSMIRNPHAGILPIMDRCTIQNAAMRAEFVVRSDADFVVAEIDLQNPEQLEMILEYDPSALALVGCERPVAETGEVVLGSSELRVHDPQEGPYRFIFRKRAVEASSPLHLRLDCGDWSAQESLGITPPPG